jgi:integrase-like protein
VPTPPCSALPRGDGCARATSCAGRSGLLKKAGLPPIRPFDLRHSSATLLLLAGEDSKVVAERMGHSTTRLTQDTYQHVLPGMQERAAGKLDAIFRQQQQPRKEALRDWLHIGYKCSLGGPAGYKEKMTQVFFLEAFVMSGQSRDRTGDLRIFSPARSL